MEKANHPTKRLRDNLSIVSPNILDYVTSICFVLRVDTLDFKNRLCHIGNSLRRIDRTMKKITRIIEKQAAKE